MSKQPLPEFNTNDHEAVIVIGLKKRMANITEVNAIISGPPKQLIELLAAAMIEHPEIEQLLIRALISKKLGLVKSRKITGSN